MCMTMMVDIIGIVITLADTHVDLFLVRTSVFSNLVMSKHDLHIGGIENENALCFFFYNEMF